MLRRFQILYILKAFFYAPITFTKRVLLGRDPYWKQFFWNRWGFVDSDVKKGCLNKNVFLLIAGSFGEVNEIFSFTKKLRQLFPEFRIVVATNTVTGFQLAQKNAAIDYVIDQSWDVVFAVNNMLHSIKPKAVLVIDQARDPILLRQAKKQNIPTILCSGFFPSEWEFAVGMKRSMEQKFYLYLDAIGVKSHEDLMGFLRIGADSKKTKITGDLKCDYEHIYSDRAQKDSLRSSLGFNEDIPVVLAASIHKEEFKLIGKAFFELQSRYQTKDIYFVFVPRYLSDVDICERELLELGYKCVRRSLLPVNPSYLKDHIIIVDTMGELAKLYAVSSVALIGGSFVSINGAGEGGHNIMEPLIQGCPFIFGCHMKHRKDILKTLIDVFSGMCVERPTELGASMARLLSDSYLRGNIKQALKDCLIKNKNGVDLTISFILESLSKNVDLNKEPQEKRLINTEICA